MDVLKQVRPGRLAVLAIPLVAVVAMLVLVWGHAALQTAQAEGDDVRMTLNVDGSGTSCDSDSEPAECSVPLGGDFTLSVDVVEPPDAGYVVVQTFIDYGSDLTYTPREEPADEVVWPDLAEDVVLRGETGPGLANHGGLTGILPPLPVSEYAGTVVELDMTCTDEFSETTVKLLPSGDPVASTDGSMFADPGGIIQYVPKGESLVIICGEAAAPTSEEEEATATPPEDLPPTGTGTFGSTDGDGGLGAGVWAIIGVLLAVAAGGLAVFGWRVARGRQAS